jgi:hypothetical protein
VSLFQYSTAKQKALYLEATRILEADPHKKREAKRKARRQAKQRKAYLRKQAKRRAGLGPIVGALDRC